MKNKISTILFFGSLLFLTAACDKQNSATAPMPDDPAAAQVVLAQLPDKVDYSVNATLGDKILYYGFDLDPETPERGKDFTMTTYFKVLQDVKEDYRIFGHFETLGKPFSRHRLDHWPTGNKFPTGKWKKDQIIKDVFIGQIPKGFPGTKAILYSGFFKNDIRLEVKEKDKADGENRVKAAEFKLAATRVDTLKYSVYKAGEKIEIDGKLDEKAWGMAASTGLFTDIYGDRSVTPATEAKMLYDTENLYVAVILKDEDVWGDYTKRDDALYREEALEIMIDADGNGATYYEIQVSPANVVYDAFFPFRRKDRNLEWDAKMKTAVTVQGTLNKRDDTDEGWTLEMALPLSSIEDAGRNPPAPGDGWRLNFYRMERPKHGGVVAAMWTPTLVGDFHTLDRFGTIFFEEKPVAERPLDATTEQVKNNVGGSPLRKTLRQANVPASVDGKTAPAEKQAN